MDQRMAAHAFYTQMFPELDESELRLFALCQDKAIIKVGKGASATTRPADGRITHFCGNVQEAIGDPNVDYGVTNWPDLSCSFILQVEKLCKWTGDKQFADDHHLSLGSPVSMVVPNGDRPVFHVEGIFKPPPGGSPQRQLALAISAPANKAFALSMPNQAVGTTTRMDQIEAEAAEKHLAHEARSRPLALARRLRNVSRLAFRGMRARLL